MQPARQSITVATAGHVDHGKTSLVNWITGINTDTLAEEKSRGLSINLGFAYRHLAKTESADNTELTIGFVDVPGHTDFINNALAGIGSADFALLVVAADAGVMPQTREHLAIINLLGIAAGAVVITKIDKADADQVAATQQQLQELVTDTGFETVPVFPVSAQSGEGMESLVEYLEVSARTFTARPLPATRYPRFTVDRSFTVKGIGTVVTGTIIAGTVTSQDTLLHSDSGTTTRVKGLRRDQQGIDNAVAGERVAISVSLPHQQVSRGDWLLDEFLYHPAHRLDVRLQLLEPVKFKSGVSYHFYHGTAHQLIQIRQLSEESTDYYQLTSAEPIYANFGDRFILRDPACTRTIGGGCVIDSFVPRRGRSSSERITALRAMDQDDYPALCALLKLQSGGVDLRQFSRVRNCNPEGIAGLLSLLEEEQIPITRLEIGQDSVPIILYQPFLNDADQQILQELADFHQAQPSQTGVAEPALSKLVNFENSHLLFHAIIDRLVSQQQMQRTGTLLHLPGHKARLSPEEKNFLDQIRPILQDARFLPPRTRELAEMTGMKLGGLERVLAQARKSGNLIQVADNRHYLPETMLQLAEFTESLAGGKDDGFTVIEFRDQLGIGRNLCIEILEYFDRVGFTVRDGNSRYLRTSRENLFGKLRTGTTT
ncbi:MAG: selenocysteine-specific translation elongation factor [Gammaproteobacteria bacterium]|nr:selenocysteine-specific translation elongation factor [Gammaproteobacteria bacterium]